MENDSLNQPDTTMKTNESSNKTHLHENTKIVVIGYSGLLKKWISSKPILVLAFLTATLVITSTLLAQKAATPKMAEETITSLMTHDLADVFRQRSSDVRRGLSARL